MSYETHRTVAQAVVTDKNVGKFIETLDFDEDINGNNGDEFTSEEALKRGFESTLEMILADTEKKTARYKGEKKVNAFVDTFLTMLQDEDGHYDGSEVLVLKIAKNKFVVTFILECTT
jgi:hypothetical protein